MLALDSYVTTSFDLWMSRFGHDTFSKLIVGTLSCDSGAFWNHWYDWICNGNVGVAYVKDEVGDMSTLAQTLILVVRYALLAFRVPWQTSHFQQTCQYASPQ
jgi:hypothetical protein